MLNLNEKLCFFSSSGKMLTCLDEMVNTISPAGIFYLSECQIGVIKGSDAI